MTDVLDLPLVDEEPLVDVNEAFYTEQTQRRVNAEMAAAEFDAKVASGLLVNLGRGRYKINEPGSFDNGEIITKQVGPDGKLILEPQHGLDVDANGKVAVYSRVPVWHELANLIPQQDQTDIDKVLAAGGIDWEVTKVPATYTNPVTGQVEPLPGMFHTCRMDTGKALGTVGAVYDPFQNRDSFEFLLRLIGAGQATWESAGALRGGARTFACLLLPQEVLVDPKGVCDKISPFLIALNDHSGRGKFRVILTPWRPVCGNTERMAVRDAIYSWGVRHTPSLASQLEEAQHTLHLATTYYDELTAELDTLAQTQVTVDQFGVVLDDLFGKLDEEASSKKVTNWTTRRNRQIALWHDNVAQLGHTAYAAERALTEYADWNTRLRPGRTFKTLTEARATAAIEGSADNFKSRAHRRLMDLADAR